MIGTSAAQAILVVYAIFLGVGGLMGYLRAGSRPSLIAGSISAVVALIAAAILTRDPRGLTLGVVLSAAMLVVFAIRFARSRKFMPSGLLAIISLAVLAALLGGSRPVAVPPREVRGNGAGAATRGDLAATARPARGGPGPVGRFRA